MAVLPFFRVKALCNKARIRFGAVVTPPIHAVLTSGDVGGMRRIKNKRADFKLGMKPM